MTNQAGQKVSLMRLIFALLSIGACLTIIVILFAIPLDADRVSNCWFLYSDDIELLASCLDWTVDTSFTEEPTEHSVTVSGPTFSCDGDYLVISFEFDQLISRTIWLTWWNDGSEMSTSTSIRDSSEVSFVLMEAIANEGSYSIAGLILYVGDDTFSYGFESWEVDSCAPPSDEPIPPTATATPNPDGVPEILNSQCLNRQQLMIVFEFEQAVTGEYDVIVNGEIYNQEPVPSAPERMYFFGAAPPGGGMPLILVLTVPDQAIALQVTDYEVPQCDFTAPGNNGGNDDYVPPPPEG